MGFIKISDTNSFIVSKKNSMKTLNAVESLVMWGATVCHNPMGSLANLWTTGTVGQQFY
jgi:hypothetical protein